MTMLGSRTDPRSSFRLLALALGLLAVTQGAPCQAEGKPQPKRPRPSLAGIEQCAQVSASARMEAYGFTHVVSLRNGCDRAVSCEVWTDVDPTPHQALRAEPGETQELITRRGSPAREVSGGSSCHYD